MDSNVRLKFSSLVVLLSLWLGWTCLVDFIVVPAVFRNVSSFFEAGNLGILLFTKLNYLEIILASMVFGILALIFKNNRRSLPLFMGSFLVLLIAFTYFIWLIPKITELTELWKLSEAGKAIGIQDIQQEHQFYHRIYVSLDGIKIVFLTLLLGLTIGKPEWTK